MEMRRTHIFARKKVTLSATSYIRWRRLIPFLCVVVTGIALLIWVLVASRPAMVRKLDAMITAQEARGMQHLLLTNIFGNLLLTGLALWAAGT